MTDDLKMLTCSLCDKDTYMLIKIELASDSWGSVSGVCSKCFKEGNIDEKIFLKQKKFLREQLKHATSRVEYWDQKLTDLKQK